MKKSILILYVSCIFYHTYSQSPSIIKIDKISHYRNRGGGLTLTNSKKLGNHWYFTSDYNLYRTDLGSRPWEINELDIYKIDENGNRLWGKRLYSCDTGAIGPGGILPNCRWSKLSTFEALNPDNVLYVMDDYGSESELGELDSNGNLIYRVAFTKGMVLSLINDGNYYYIVSKYSQNLYFTKLNRNGELVSELTFINIDSFDLSSNGLLLIKSDTAQLVKLSDFSTRLFTMGGQIGKLVSQDFIITNDNKTLLVKSNGELLDLTDDKREIYVLPNGGFILYKDGNFKKYNPNFQLEYDENLGVLKEINIGANTIIIYENNIIKKYGLANFQLVFQKNLESLNIVNIVSGTNLFVFDTEKVYVSTAQNLIELDNNAEIKWQKSLGWGYLNGVVKLRDKLQLSIDDYSLDWEERRLKVIISDLENVCNYEVSTNIPENYCGRSDYNYFVGYLGSNVAGCFDSIFSYEWKKDGELYSNNKAIFPNQSGLYTFTLRQGTCEQSASTYLTVYSPPTSISAAPSNICVGNNAILSGSCSAGSLKWYSDQWLVNEVSSTVRPSSTSNYYGVCSFNTCKSTSVQTNVVVSNTPPPAPGVFSNFTDFVCQSAGNRTYEIAPVSQAAGYEWSYTGNGVSVSSQGTRAVANFSSTASSGNIRVRSIGACGSSNYLSMGVEVLPLSLRINDRRDYGVGSRNSYRVGKSIELLPSNTTAINISNGAVFKAEVIACPN